MERSLFIASSWLHIYNFLKVIQNKNYKENNIIIIESHNNFIQSFKLVNKCYKLFKIRLLHTITNENFGGFKGLLNQKFKYLKSIKSLINLDNLDFYTSNDRYFLSQLLMHECKQCNYNYIEEGSDIYYDLYYYENFYKILIKKILFPKYKSIPYLGSHPLIKKVYVSNDTIFYEILKKKFIDKGKFLKTIPPALNNKKFIECICKILCKQYSPSNSTLLLIVSNTEIISNPLRYIEFYTKQISTVIDKYKIDSLFIKFHPRENNATFKKMFIKQLYILFSKLKVKELSDNIPLEILLDYYIQKNKKLYICGDISSAILLAFFFNKGQIFNYLPKLCYNNIIKCNYNSNYIRKLLLIYSNSSF